MFHVKTAKRMKYLFALENSYDMFIEELINAYFDCDYGYIHDGHLRIFKGYSWDGCTCAINTSKTYYPCLIHDFLCQYNPVDILIVDRIFLKMLTKNKFELSYIYYVFVMVYHKITRVINKVRWLRQKT